MHLVILLKVSGLQVHRKIYVSVGIVIQTSLCEFCHYYWQKATVRVRSADKKMSANATECVTGKRKFDLKKRFLAGLPKTLFDFWQDITFPLFGIEVINVKVVRKF